MKRFPSNRIMPRPSQQRGIALFIGLVFLVVLSLVAVIAMQSTFLEMRMVTNVARHEEAFQASDSLRNALTAPPDANLFEQSLVNGGWPQSWGGDVVDNDFSNIGDCNAPWTDPATCALELKFKGGLINGTDGKPKLLYGALDAPGANSAPVEDPADPTTWITDDTFTFTDPNNASDQLTVAMSAVPDGGGVNAGSGAAQAAGYRGLGVGLAGGGASRYFQIQSVGTSPANGRAVTIAQYKAIVK